MSSDGVLVIDKPAGPTSHDVVQSVRRALKVRAGHTGTLDPDATGVLVVTLGRATRLTRFLQAADKVYEAEVRLGRTTDTYDAGGRTVEEKAVPEISRPEVDRLLERFRGTLPQRPPMYSAVRVEGKRLYRLARQNREVERPMREVTVFRIRLLEQDAGTLTLEVHCSAGTYIRVLAHEIGRELGCGAHLGRLQRTRSGEYSLGRSVPLESVVRGGSEWRQAYHPMEEVLTSLERVDLTDPQARLVRHGGRIDLPVTFEGGWLRLFHRNRLLAVAQGTALGVQPKVVLAPDSES